MENERIAKLETTVDSIKEAVGRLEQKFDHFMSKMEAKFLPRAEYESMVERLEDRLNSQEEEISQLRKNVGKLPAWAGSIISMLFTAVIALIAALFGK